MRELELRDVLAYKEFFTKMKEQFSFLLGKVSLLIQKKEQPSPINSVRATIQPDECLAVTLRYLAMEETHHSLEYSFRISRQTISLNRVRNKPCPVQEYLKVPNTESEWDAGAEKFEARWHFPNGTGAVDRKRVIVQQPSNSGSDYYDYKGNNSIVLPAVFGPDYQCLWASAGTNGRSPDSAIWQNCDLKKALSLSHNTLNLPKPRALPETAMPVPYVLTGDSAFALTRLMMKPFPLTGLSRGQRIFNYRLSRMCRISENRFGIIANRWRVFRAPILLPPYTVVDLILVACTSAA
ncbi:hypothetical protein AWC38_SpisGene23938 [Stylophora pistillata]|uniref:DDE Tnp4 domain-containing protein n=2 Tax=Stylophora pistillata TaxID=50429 RepID=A0A2B4R6N6_STYPI|nr:hypothetical protein AWC38_SpisGene23938 [Stylophora pistillata]